LGVFVKGEFRRGDLVVEIGGNLHIHTVVGQDTYSYIFRAFYNNCIHRFMIGKAVAERDFVRVGREKRK